MSNLQPETKSINSKWIKLKKGKESVRNSTIFRDWRQLLSKNKKNGGEKYPTNDVGGFLWPSKEKRMALALLFTMMFYFGF